ncbi:MAG: 3-deoxy-8-phosphooctulonate synthase, partial [Thermodesulfovibrionales bacterium]
MITLKDISKTDNTGPLIIAGPCVIESQDILFETASVLRDICERLRLNLIFKSSYDKANRTSIQSYRGPGIDRGLTLLNDIKQRFNLPIITDVHSTEEIKIASQVVDVLQIPAFLCRQTDLIVSASNTGR